MKNTSIKNFMLRIIILFIGLTIMAIGASTLIISAIGADSVLVFSDGVSNVFGIKFGTAIFFLNAVLLLVILVVNRKKIHIGTLIVTLVIGPFINIVMDIGLIPEPTSFVMSLIMTFLACFITSFGIALYMFSNVGLAPFEAMIVSIQENTKLRFAFVKIGFDAVLFLVGWLMGGAIGVGSIIALLIFGPAIELFYNLLKRSKWNHIVADVVVDVT